jgi:hypothetical protein
MNFFTKIIVLLLLPMGVFAQTTCLHFNGNDYVDLGPQSINGARTIEMWFNLDSPFDENSTGPQTLIARNTTFCNSCDEVNIALWATSSQHDGQLRFTWQDEGNNVYIIWSDTNVWEANRWYHVAGVIDAELGMMLFVDGMKQAQTFTDQGSAVTTSDTTTRLGIWGAPSQPNPRYFKGAIENVRISSDARYTANFTPYCLDTIPTSTTMSLWLFDEGSGLLAGDNGFNGIDGAIVGATWILDSICVDLDTTHTDTTVTDTNLASEILKHQQASFRIYPNPAANLVNIQGGESLRISQVSVFDPLGRLVVNQLDETESGISSFDVSKLRGGLYIVVLVSDQGTSENLRLIKN